MNLRGIQSLALLLWGWQGDLLLFAIPMAIVWETRFFLNRRWSLTKQDFYLMADLTAVSLVLIIVFLFLNRADYHFISTLMQWLPILFFPLTITTGYSTEPKLTLDVLFYSLRRQKQPVTQTVDMDYVLFGFLIVSSGTSKEIGFVFFPVLAMLVFLALLPLRSNRYKKNIWVLTCTLVFLAAFATQTGIRETHLELRKRAQVWFAQWIQHRTNPLKSHTSIGQIGRLKLSDTILYRIPKTPGTVMPSHLREAVYDQFGSTIWSVIDSDSSKFSEVEPIDSFLWAINDKGQSTDNLIEIFHEFNREQDLVAIPPGTTRIQDLPAVNIEQNYYGVVRGNGLVVSPSFMVYAAPQENYTGLPKSTDTVQSVIYEELVRDIIRENDLDPEKPIQSLRRYFADFRFSLYQPADMASEPIEEFLLRRKAGHCEFFATTTVLMLREMGIPARYVTGYAVQEYNALLDMYVVRRRHAHAWAIAYIDGKWQDVDTTPAVWLETESQQATMLQPLMDVVSNLTFMFQVWWNDQKIEDYEEYLYGIGFLLSLIILWRISRGEQVILKDDDDSDLPADYEPPPESPVLAIENFLIEQGFTRDSGEVLSKWFARIGHPELINLLPLHNRLRFHPAGLAESDRATLDKGVASALDQLTVRYQDVGETD